MGGPAPGGPGRSPLRVAGVALVGLALVLAVVGALSGSTVDPPASTTAAGPSGTPVTTTTSPATTTSPTTTTPDPAPAVAPTTLPPATTTVAPTTAAPDPRAGVDVVVLNNSTVGGLASRAAADVRGRGWTVVEVGNFPGLIPTTTVYYRPGTDEEAAARALAADTRARVEPRFAGLPSTAAGVVIVVTSDYAG